MEVIMKFKMANIFLTSWSPSPLAPEAKNWRLIQWLFYQLDWFALTQVIYLTSCSLIFWFSVFYSSIFKTKTRSVMELINTGNYLRSKVLQHCNSRTVETQYWWLNLYRLNSLLKQHTGTCLLHRAFFLMLE